MTGNADSATRAPVRVDPTAARDAIALMLHRQNDTPEIRGTESAKQTGPRPWTSSDVAELRRLAPLGVLVAAQALRRSIASVKLQAHRQRISLRPPGERRGLLLGQSPKVKGPVVAKVRRDVLAGEVDQTRIVRLVELAAAGAPLCPMCGREPIETPAGLGVICHNRELTHAHELETDRIASERELDAARQRKHRAKEKVTPWRS